MTPTPITVPLASPDVPVTFVLNGTGELEVKSVVATFDGTGAGGTFDAVCSVYTQDDKLISRTKPVSSIAAGASAVVTFAPFLRKPAVAASGGIVGGFLVYPTADTTIASGGNSQLTLDGTLITQGSVFSTADNQFFDLIDGLWLVGAQTFWHPNAAAPNADGAVKHRLNLTNLANPIHFATQYTQPGRDGGGSTSVDVQLTTVYLAQTSGFPGTSLLSLRADNTANGSQIVRGREDRTFMWGVCLSA